LTQQLEAARAANRELMTQLNASEGRPRERAVLSVSGRMRRTHGERPPPASGQALRESVRRCGDWATIMGKVIAVLRLV
jgi:hypothetical protein